MVMKQILHMNGGDGETSYAKNSGLQGDVLLKTWPVLDETLKDMYNERPNNGFPIQIKIADLGCSSGPNTVLLVSHIVDTIQDLCQNDNIKTYLNSRQVHDNKERKLECFIYGVPGSFYGRLFPSSSLQFAYSSFSLHWLSQAPKEVGKNNKENNCIAMNSPRQVIEAYANQFHKDFSTFLSLRAEEITSGGHMILAFISKGFTDSPCNDDFVPFQVIVEALSVLVAQDHVKKEDLYSFNMPFYTPSLQEAEAIIGGEGSLNLDKMEVVMVPWDTRKEYDYNVLDENAVTNYIRAIVEPMLVFHFGSSIVDDVFDIYMQRKLQSICPKRDHSISLQLFP